MPARARKGCQNVSPKGSSLLRSIHSPSSYLQSQDVCLSFSATLSNARHAVVAKFDKNGVELPAQRSVHAEIGAEDTVQTQSEEDTMPAKSKAQQKAAGAALSAKRGETPLSKLKGASRSMADFDEREAARRVRPHQAESAQYLRLTLAETGRGRLAGLVGPTAEAGRLPRGVRVESRYCPPAAAARIARRNSSGRSASVRMPETPARSSSWR